MRLGPYEVTGELGRGGVGLVHRARTPDGREVAIKVLLRGRASAALERFGREQRLLTAFSMADGFVPVIDAGDGPAGPYLVMPLVTGGTLRDRLTPASPGRPAGADVEGRALPIEEAVSIVRQVADAVGRAHARGIVHRDLKPENVLFTDDERPLVADLGLAKHFASDAPGASQTVALTQAGEARGTIGYMAPEQIEDSRSVGPPADVFALGAILYECVAGTSPFASDTTHGVLARVLRCDFDPLQRVRRDCPAWLARVVARALARSASERDCDATELAAALAAGPAGSEPSSTRARVAVAAGAVAVVVVAAAAALAVTSRHVASPPRGRHANGGDARSGDARSGDVSSGDASSGDARSGDARSGDARSGDARSGDARSGDASSGDASSGDASSGDASSGDASSGDASSGDARSGDASSGDARGGDASGPPRGREALRRMIRGEVAPVVTDVASLREVVREAEADPPPRARPIEEAALEALRIAAGDRPPAGASELVARLARAPAVRSVLRDVLYRQALEVKGETPRQAALRAAAELGPPGHDELRGAIVHEWLEAARPGLKRIAELSRAEPDPGRPLDVLRGINALAMAQRADPTAALLDQDPDAGEVVRQLLPLVRARSTRPDSDLKPLVDELVRAFPEDVGLRHCGLLLAGIAWDDPEGLRRALDDLSRLRRTSRGAGPTWWHLHDELVTDLRYRFDVRPDGARELRAFLRREVASSPCGAKARVLLAEACVADAPAVAPDAARALLAEARAAIDAIVAGQVLASPPVRAALDEAEAGLRWFEALPPGERPRAPLPRGVTWTAEPGVYRLEADGSRLRWIPPARFTMGSGPATDVGQAAPAHEAVLERGSFLGEIEVTAAQYELFLRATPDQHLPPMAALGVAFAVAGVSWQEATRYCQWAGGAGGSLPSEALWELAARGPDQGREARERGHETPPRARAVPAGADPQDRSPFGCLDMSRGLEEWVQDLYARHGEPESGAEQRTLRGGAWSDPADPRYNLTRRRGEDPGYASPLIGFRIALRAD